MTDMSWMPWAVGGVMVLSFSLYEGMAICPYYNKSFSGASF